MDLTLSWTLNSPMESYEGTFEEPKVKMGKPLHKIKAKGVREILEHAKSLYKSSVHWK